MRALLLALSVACVVASVVAYVTLPYKPPELPPFGLGGNQTAALALWTVATLALCAAIAPAPIRRLTVATWAVATAAIMLGGAAIVVLLVTSPPVS
ncbi:MAG: hypothetical protein ACXWPJ_03365 [Candidatus Limnocylindrales bacterium]